MVYFGTFNVMLTQRAAHRGRVGSVYGEVGQVAEHSWEAATDLVLREESAVHVGDEDGGELPHSGLAVEGQVDEHLDDLVVALLGV